MARTALAAQDITDAGVVVALSAANADGHMINPGEILIVDNADAAPINVTIQTGATLQGKAVADTVIAVAAGARKYIGSLKRRVYEQKSGADRGKIYVDFSAVTDVTVAALKQSAIDIDD